MLFSICRIALFLLVSFFWASSLWALPPPVPSAGVVERELEKEYESKPLEPTREMPAIQIEIPEEKLSIPDGKKVLIRSIEIRGNQSIPSKTILKWVEGYLNSELSLKEIYALCQVIDRNYAKKGYFLARAYPPPQEIQEGVLVIEILEGRLGSIRVMGNRYYRESFILSYFSSLQGRPLQYDAFLRALMLLNDNSDLIAGAVFEKGKEFGCADVLLQVKDSRPVHLYFNANNYGKDLTTNMRAGGRLDWGNFFLQGDTLSVAEVLGFPVSALYFTDVRYRAPLNRKGTAMEASYLFSRFRVEELKRLHLKGQSMIATLKMTQALFRRRSFNLDLFSYFDYKQIQNFARSSRVSFDKLRVLTVGMLFDHFSSYQSRDYLTLRMSAGIPGFLGGLKAVDKESSREGGGGRFFLFAADYDRIQKFPKDLFLYLHGSMQLSPSKLTLPEQIYIGGSNTVRGFPLAEALGDSGYYLNGEFRFPSPFLANKKFFKLNAKWKDVLQLAFFLDHGGVFLQSQSNTFLWGSGVGLRIHGPYHFDMSLDVGFPLNHRSINRGAFIYFKVTCQAF